MIKPVTSRVIPAQATGGSAGSPLGESATLADIARAAGVSTPTVSKVLNGRADVAPATRERVEALL